MDLHAFLQQIDGARVVEHAKRADALRPNTGFVLEAAYLEVLAAPLGWLERLRGWFGASAPRVAPARGTQLHFCTPFGPQGQDALGLFHEGVAFVNPTDTIAAGVRRAVGRAALLQGGDPVIFDDLWVDDHGWRVSQGQDFAVVTEDQRAVIVSCGLAPLIIARPRRLSVAKHQSRWTPALHALQPRPETDAEGWCVSLQEGDEVEILGVVRPLRDSQRSFQIEDGSYRTIPTRPTQVLGDEDGTRLVMRVLSVAGKNTSST